MNYLITEAVAIKVSREDAAERKKAEDEAKRKQFREEQTAKLKAMAAQGAFG